MLFPFTSKGLYTKFALYSEGAYIYVYMDVDNRLSKQYPPIYRSIEYIIL